MTATTPNRKPSTRKRPTRQQAARQQRAIAVMETFDRLYPDATCSLTYDSIVQLLVATILSAQCTDERVNQVTPALFARFPDAEALASSDRDELEQLIRSTGFYRNKAKNIQGACQKIVRDFGGEVPQDMEKLLTLPGVARKTANVVLGHGYGINQGVTVDTHVRRLSQRLDLTDESDPIKIERDLMALLPQAEWENFSIRTIYHGRAVCNARKPQCDRCELAAICPSAFQSDASTRESKPTAKAKAKTKAKTPAKLKLKP